MEEILNSVVRRYFETGNLQKIIKEHKLTKWQRYKLRQRLNYDYLIEYNHFEG